MRSGRAFPLRLEPGLALLRSPTAPVSTVHNSSFGVTDQALSFSDTLTASRISQVGITDSALGGGTAATGLASNSAEGGSATATVTTANSGGTSGTAWNNVAIGAGSTLTYDSTNQAHGSGLSYKVALGTTVTATYLEWSTALGTLTTNQHLGGRFYYTPGASIPSSSIRLAQILNGSTILCSIYHASGTGKLEIHDSAGTLLGTASGQQLTAATLWRIEFDLTGIGGGAGAGGGTLRIFAGDSATASGADASGSAGNFGSLAPNTFRVGVTTANSTISVNHYFDGIQVNTTGMPGPESTSGISDSVSTSRGYAPGITDTALSFSDAIGTTRQRTVTDTALSFSDSVVSTRQRAIADTALNFSDSVGRQPVRRTILDTALSFSEAIGTTIRRTISDTALSFSESPLASRARTIADQALSFSDTVISTRPRTVSDTALSLSESIGTTRQRTVADTALSFSDSVARRPVQRTVTDTVLSFSDSLVRTSQSGVADAVIASGTVYTDTYTRTVGAGGWGTTDSGQVWSAMGSSSPPDFSVNGTTGLVTPAIATVQIMGIDAGGGVTDGDLLVDVASSLVPTSGGYNMGVGIRTQAVSPEQNYYRFRIILSTTGANPSLEMAVVNNNTATVSQTATTAFAYAAGDIWRIRVRATQNHLQARAWPVGQAEPGTWNVDRTDGTFAKGGILIRAQTQASSSGTPTYSYDSLSYGVAFDTLTATKTRGSTPITDTALSFSDSLVRTVRRTVTDTALSLSDSVVSTRQQTVADTALTFSDAVTTPRNRTVTDTALTFSDTLAASRQRAITDTALAFSDLVGHAKKVVVTDTVLVFGDAVTASRPHSVTDTALSFSDSLSRAARRAVTDTALVFSDTVGRTAFFARTVSDVALSFSDVVTTPRSRSVTDTALAFSDSLGRTTVRRITDVALTFSDAFTITRRRVVTDTAITFSDTIHISHGPITISITDTALNFSDFVATVRPSPAGAPPLIAQLI